MKNIKYSDGKTYIFCSRKCKLRSSQSLIFMSVWLFSKSHLVENGNVIEITSNSKPHEFSETLDIYIF